MATPHATGAALVASAEPALLNNPEGLKNRIMNGKPLLAAAGKTVSGDMVDALKALKPPADTEAPTVSSVVPIEEQVDTTTNVVASFSEAMEAASVTDPANFTLRNVACASTVAATLSYASANENATLDPSAPLDASSTYTVTVSGAWDLTGNQLDQDPNTSGDQAYSWSFTTAAPPPGTSLPTPNVYAWGSNGAGTLGDCTNTNRTTRVQVGSLSSVKDVSSGGVHSLAVKDDGTVWTWGRPDCCTPDRTIPMQVGGLSGITYAVGGMEINTYYSLAISSDIPAPKIGPMVSEVYPADGATGVLRSTDIAALFSEPIDPATVTTSTVTLVKDGMTTPISIKMGLVDSYPEKLWISPWSNAGPVELDANTKYTVKIKGGTDGVKDLEGNQLGGGNQVSGDYWWSFTTATPQYPSCTITGTANAETISGTSADDVICAGEGNDTVKGLGGTDTLLGEGGNDTLLGGVGNDTLDGGTGTDTASYSASLTAVTASLATNSATGEGSDSYLGVENLLGSSKADTLTGSDTDNELTGEGGNDIERGGLGNDQVIGSGGADTLKGENGDDTVNSKDGKNGNDSLDGGAGTDTKVTDATEKSIVGFP